MSTNELTQFDIFRRRRDESSFRRLYRRHTPMLFALALRLCGSREEAEELTQEAWVRAVENLGNFDRKSKFGTWLTGILINCFREAARRHARRPLPFDEADERGNDSVVTEFPVRKHTPADLMDVERALSRLSPGYREIVILHDLNGYTHQEIALMLGIQEGTSKSQLQRGRSRLRELLTDKPPSSDSRDERGTS